MPDPGEIMVAIKKKIKADFPVYKICAYSGLQSAILYSAAHPKQKVAVVTYVGGPVGDVSGSSQSRHRFNIYILSAAWREGDALLGIGGDSGLFHNVKQLADSLDTDTLKAYVSGIEMAHITDNLATGDFAPNTKNLGTAWGGFQIEYMVIP